MDLEFIKKITKLICHILFTLFVFLIVIFIMKTLIEKGLFGDTIKNYYFRGSYFDNRA